MPDKAVIALDVMGGDFGPDVVIPAAVSILKKRDDLKIILVGKEDEIQAYASNNNISFHDSLTVHHASEVVGSHDDPALAMRKKKDSSMRVAINLVHQGVAQAAVSAGNTGALMATSKFVLKTLPGITRPAICTTLPSLKGHTHMLDLGANADCSAENLMQFAIMGSVLAEAMENISSPKVGLLNIGHESTKGNALVKQTHELLENTPINYIGFVEGDDIYTGDVDVVVCDGFVGNVALKTSEGVAQMITQFMKEEFKKSLFKKLAALIALPVLKAFKSRIDHREYNGASLLGLKGIVIKSHGSADVFAFANSIEIALLEIQKSVPLHIKEHIEPLLARKAV